jgi:ankyrin repeat protein
MAAVREDIEALRLLVRYGADLTIRTRIDEYATPLEEARILGKQHAVKFLEKFA